MEGAVLNGSPRLATSALSNSPAKPIFRFHFNFDFFLCEMVKIWTKVDLLLTFVPEDFDQERRERRASQEPQSPGNSAPPKRTALCRSVDAISGCCNQDGRWISSILKREWTTTLLMAIDHRNMVTLAAFEEGYLRTCAGTTKSRGVRDGCSRYGC